MLTRSVGVNLHPTSLAGGRLGAEAYAFVDWLAAAGARFWQILPLNPPDHHGSPYASASAFAASPGLLADPEARVEPSELRRFEAENAYWIADWMAFAGGDALAEQVRFEREWSALRAYASSRGVRLVGDVPIYVAADSCDHLAHSSSSCPAISWPARRRTLERDGPEMGQSALRLGGDGSRRYRWWTERMRRTLGLVDVFRIDHFRGFAEFWAVRQRGDGAGRQLGEGAGRGALPDAWNVSSASCP